ncbi:MAG: hypothetical protein ACE15E_16590 [Acidobacteriota bacterium]
MTRLTTSGGVPFETAKLAEANDYVVISGWESTSIENHSGLVDNLRNFKGNPELLSKRLAPVRLVIKPDSLTIARGARNQLDLFLLNETGAQVKGPVTLCLTDPDGTSTDLGNFRIPPIVKDKFVYLLAENVETPALVKPGIHKLTLHTLGENRLSSEEGILVVDVKEPVRSLGMRVGVLSFDPRVQQTLRELGVDAVPYRAGEGYRVAVLADRMSYGWTINQRGREIRSTEDHELYQSPAIGMRENLAYTITGLPSGRARVTLKSQLQKSAFL